MKKAPEVVTVRRFTGRLTLAAALVAAASASTGACTSPAPESDRTDAPQAPAPTTTAGGQLADELAAQLLAADFAETIGVVATNPLVRGEKTRLAVELAVADGYHVNANPPSEDWLIATELALKGGEGVTIVEAYYPDALEREFGFWSAPLRVYEGSVVIGAVLEVDAEAPLGGRDLVLSVTYQACNDEACFKPKQATYSVAVEVAAAGTPTREFASPLLARARFAALR